MIDISRTDTLSAHPHGPHFIQVHDRHQIELEGESAYELPVQEFLDWLGQHPDDPLAIEAVALLTNNHGLTFKHWLWTAGERDMVLLFAKDPTYQAHLEPLHPARILGDNLPHPNYPESAPLIRAYVSELLTIIGIRPNLARIDAEFCKTCRG